jgi:hypothetical protein
MRGRASADPASLVENPKRSWLNIGKNAAMLAVDRDYEKPASLEVTPAILFCGSVIRRSLLRAELLEDDPPAPRMAAAIIQTINDFSSRH